MQSEVVPERAELKTKIILRIFLKNLSDVRLLRTLLVGRFLSLFILYYDNKTALKDKRVSLFSTFYDAQGECLFNVGKG